ncbi:MAG: MotA/TolQ/ExbB proton channel family protein [Pyrinomonadaceae bacterium]
MGILLASVTVVTLIPHKLSFRDVAKMDAEIGDLEGRLADLRAKKEAITNPLVNEATEMARISSMQKAGIAVVVMSFLGGALGTVWSIYSSLMALDASANAGIGAVGDKILNALLWSVGGVVGMIIGGVLVVLGRTKRDVRDAARN